LLFEVTDLKTFVYVADKSQTAAKELAAKLIKKPSSALVAAMMQSTEAKKINVGGSFTVWDRFVQMGGPRRRS